MTIKFWTMGSLAGTSWADLVLPTIVVGMVFLFFSTQYRVFNAMMMGDEAALTLGIPLRFYWYLYVTMVAVLTAVLVATCGIIGFVGLITPHLARGLVGTNYRRLFLLRLYWVPFLLSGQTYSLVSSFQTQSFLLVFSQP